MSMDRKQQELKNLRWCKKKAERKRDEKEVARLCNCIGELLSQNGQHVEAIAEHETEKQICEALRDQIGEAVACRKIGECYSSLGEYDKALKFEYRHLALAEMTNNKVEIQRALATIGRTYLNQAEDPSVQNSSLDKAERAFIRALEVCQSLRELGMTEEKEILTMKGRIFLNLGLVFDFRNDQKKSLDYFQKARSISEKNKLEEELYLCHFNMATMNIRNKNYSQALRNLHLALKLAININQKDNQGEVFIQLAMVNACIGNFSAMKHCLKKAYKILPSPKSTRKLYRTFTTIEQITHQCELSAGDDVKLFNAHEKLGDAFTEIGLYAEAILHYNEMLLCGERLGLTSEQLIPAYVSLAQTYADNRQLEPAIASYKKELELRGDDYEQVCRTWLNIADLEERMGKEYPTLRESYLNAFKCAKKASHHKLQARALQSLLLVQKNNNQEKDATRTEMKLKQIQEISGVKADVESDVEGEEEGHSSQNSSVDNDSSSDQNISISDLTESDNSDDETNIRSIHIQIKDKTKRKRSLKVNEKGETPLHLACIKGNFKKVQTFLNEGHPVNVRDACGWTPLHEAVNHNYYDIADLLIQKGADINDRGGQYCNGITPLMDAASCGNMEIMHLLIEKGVNVLAKDSEGLTALDFLQEWYERAAETLDQDTILQYTATKQSLKQAMQGLGTHIHISHRVQSSDRGITTGKKDSTVLPAATKSRVFVSDSDQISPKDWKPVGHRSKRSRQIIEKENDSNAIDEMLSVSRLNEFYIKEKSAVEEYKDVMVSVGSSAQQTVSQVTKNQDKIRKQDQSMGPLVDEEEAISDDWLIEDIKSSKRRRRNPSLEKILNHIKSARKKKSCFQSAGKKSNITDDSLTPTPEERYFQDTGGDTESTNIQDYDNIECDISTNETDNNITLPAPTTYKYRYPKVSDPSLAGGNELDNRENADMETTHRDVSPITSKIISGTMSVRVNVEGTVFLIPVSLIESKTVAWLCEEASQRYSSYTKQNGNKPILALSNADGAILSADDIVTTVVSHNEKLDGKIQGWNRPPLSDRYTQICKNLCSVKHKNISYSLKTAETTCILNLSDLSLQNAVFPLMNALHCLTNLSELHLPGNKIGDNGLQALVKVLPDFVSLKILDLASNGITHVGLENLTNMLSLAANITYQPRPAISSENTKHPPLSCLTTLTLSHNPLGNGSGDSLCIIFKNVPSLTFLSLSACHFTAELFQRKRLEISRSLQGSSLRQLDISHNRLDSLGIECLFHCLSSVQLFQLDLSHTFSRTSCNLHSFSPQLIFNTLKFSVLKCLSLEGCPLHEEDMNIVCRLPLVCLNLNRLILSLIKSVTISSLETLLQTSAECDASHLQHVVAVSCAVTSPLPCSLEASVIAKLASRWPLETLRFSCLGLTANDAERITTVWTNHWQDISKCELLGNSILLAIEKAI